MWSFGSVFARAALPLLGLDIGTSQARLVELGRLASGRLQLRCCATEPLEPGWVHAGQVEQFDPVAQALRRLLLRSRSKLRQVAMALPASAVITRQINLPGGLSEAELELEVQAEANQYIPFPLDEASLDFCQLEPESTAGQQQAVMMAAARQERVQDLQGLAEAAGLTLAVLDLQPHAARRAAARLLDHAPSPAPVREQLLVALFEINSRSTSLQVFQGETLHYERDQDFGADGLIQGIMTQYGWSAQTAERRARAKALPEDYPDTVLAYFCDKAAGELGRALQFFLNSTAHNQVDRVLLAGWAAGLPGLIEAVRAQTGVVCALANPFDGMDRCELAAVGSDQPEHPGLAYLTACGLALRSFSP